METYFALRRFSGLRCLSIRAHRGTRTHPHRHHSQARSILKIFHRYLDFEKRHLHALAIVFFFSHSSFHAEFRFFDSPPPSSSAYSLAIHPECTSLTCLTLPTHTCYLKEVIQASRRHGKVRVQFSNPNLRLQAVQIRVRKG